MAKAATATTAPRGVDTQPIGRTPEPSEGDVKLLQRMTARLIQMDQIRLSWWVHWRELATFILPRRYRYLVTPNQNNRGVPLNQAILDSTGTVDARILAAGMVAGTVSPARPWFRLTSPDTDPGADDWEAKIWYAEVTKRLLRVMATSNYYLAKAVQYLDEVVFGTAPMIIYEDYEKVIRCYNPCAGEYYCAVGADFTVNTLGRKFTMTVAQVVDEFGLEACSQSVKQLWESAGANYDTEILILHLIEPNPDYVADDMHIGPGGVPRHFRFREYYWEMAGSNTFLRKRGYFEKPFSCPRWDVTGNDPYGRSPGMDGLGDIKQLQLEQRRKAQAIDKQVNPPMVADVQLKNQPASLLPGAITYVSGLANNVGFQPAIKVEPRIAEMVEDIRECQKRIGDVFYVPLFLMISQLETVRTAAEIDARREEQLIQLGPVLERNEAEGLSPDVTRIFQIMARAGLFPPPPESVRRRGLIKVEYVASLTQAQRATGLTAIERTWAFVGSVAQALPDVIDIMNGDESVRQYGDLMQIPPQLVNPQRVVQQKRQMRQEQQAMQAAQAAAQQAIDGAQTLSETPVGAGQSALQLMLGNGAIGRPG